MCEAMEKLETFRNSTLIGMLERWIRNASLIYRSIVVELKFVEEVPDDPFSIFPLLAKGERGGICGTLACPSTHNPSLHGSGLLLSYCKNLIIEGSELFEIGTHELRLDDQIAVHPQLRKPLL